MHYYTFRVIGREGGGDRERRERGEGSEIVRFCRITCIVNHYGQWGIIRLLSLHSLLDSIVDFIPDLEV